MVLCFTVKAKGSYGKVDVSIFLPVVGKPLGYAEPNNSAFCPKRAGGEASSGGWWGVARVASPDPWPSCCSLGPPPPSQNIPCLLSARPRRRSHLLSAHHQHGLSSLLTIGLGPGSTNQPPPLIKYLGGRGEGGTQYMKCLFFSYEIILRYILFTGSSSFKLWKTTVCWGLLHCVAGSLQRNPEIVSHSCCPPFFPTKCQKCLL